MEVASFSQGQVDSKVSTGAFCPLAGMEEVPDLMLTVLYVRMHTMSLTLSSFGPLTQH